MKMPIEMMTDRELRYEYKRLWAKREKSKFDKALIKAMDVEIRRRVQEDEDIRKFLRSN